MLCNLSANLIIMTRRSCATEISIFIKLPTCFAFLLEKLIPPSLLTPSTRFATSVPNSFSISSNDASVSSIVSCNIPPIIVI